MQSALHGNVTGYQAETADLSAFQTEFPLPYSLFCISASPLPSLLLSLKLEIETHMELERKVQSKSACKDFVRPIFFPVT